MTRWLIKRNHINDDNEILQTFIVYPDDTTTTKIMIDNEFKSVDKELMDVE